MISLLAAAIITSQSVVWPNTQSSANSDEWLVENSQKITEMRPRVLIINFANGMNRGDAEKKVADLIAAIRESSRYHGFEDADAPAFLNYQVAKFVDLTDAHPLPEKLDGNSSKYPRVPDWKEGINFQYSQLFDEKFAKYYGFEGDNDKPLTLAQLVNGGKVNEVWFLAYQGNYGSPYESIELKQAYDDHFKKIQFKFVQAGNGGDEGQQNIGRSLRILFINAERGVGCAMESLSHSFEGMSNSGAIPEFTRYFREYADFDLDKKYNMPFDSLYARNGAEMNYPDPTTIEFMWNGEMRRVKNYVPVGGNVHFPPNARKDYDMDNAQPVMSTIEHYRRFDDHGKDRATLWTPKVFDKYRTVAPDCMGPWLVYWRQNMPGYKNLSKDDAEKPMRNWWPYLFY
jgi:hypothetical protein